MRESGLFSARLLMKQFSHVGAMTFTLSGSYKELAKEEMGDGR